MFSTGSEIQGFLRQQCTAYGGLKPGVFRNDQFILCKAKYLPYCPDGPLIEGHAPGEHHRLFHRQVLYNRCLVVADHGVA